MNRVRSLGTPHGLRGQLGQFSVALTYADRVLSGTAVLQHHLSSAAPAAAFAALHAEPVRVESVRTPDADGVVRQVALAPDAVLHRADLAGATPGRQPVEVVVPVALARRVVRPVARLDHVRVLRTDRTRVAGLDVAVRRRVRLAERTRLADRVVVQRTRPEYTLARAALPAASLPVQTVLVPAASQLSIRHHNL